MIEVSLLLLCAESDVPTDSGFRIEHPDLPEAIAIFRWEGSYYGVSDMCSHADASLAEGIVEDCQVECPLHLARFDLRTGKACSLPAMRPVKTYSLHAEGGNIYLAQPEAG